MVSPRERPRPTRRRIAGERTRPSAGGPTAAPPTGPVDLHKDLEEPAREPVEAPAEAPTEPSTEPPTEAPADVPARSRVEEPTARQTAPTVSEADGERAEQRLGERSVRPGGTGRRPTLPSWIRGTDDAGPGPANWVLAVLAGLLVAALALDGFVVWREVSHRQAQEDAARAMHSAVVQAPSVAEKAASALLSYRYDRLPQDLAEARQYLTADYRPKYVDTVKNLVAGSAKDLRVTVRADVLASGVSEAGPARADVLLFVNQTTISATEDTKTALNRVVFTMVPRAGGWKVDEIQAF
jgi:Mce-associated membrane protein